MRRSQVSAVAATGLSILVCCDVYTPTKQILPGYQLAEWQGGIYFVIDEHVNSVSRGDVLGGCVEQLGWNKRHILAWRKASTDRETSGWMVIDSTSHTVTGPLKDEEVRNDESISQIRVYPVAEAWIRLGWPPW